MDAYETQQISIRIFLVDGFPDGLRTIGLSNWTGRAVMGNRLHLDRAIQSRSELDRPGVYVLFCRDGETSQKLYVGEADSLRDRLKQHSYSKDFWTGFVAFSCTDRSLNKGHVRYLEYRMLSLAKTANQWDLQNSSAPSEPPLSEEDRADAEGFLKKMLIIFPILGIDAFEEAATEVSPEMDDDLILAERGASGRGQEVSEGFVVRKGSRARMKLLSSGAKTRSLVNLRQQLIDRGILVQEGSTLVFTQDFRFSSPSLASAILVGGSSNGRIAWKSQDGKTLKKLQEDKLKQIP